MPDKPRILIKTGEGKGKTTSALGMAFRATGHGHKTLIIQFIKDSDTGEVIASKSIPNMEIVQTGLGFVPSSDKDEFALHKQAAEKSLAFATESISSGKYDLIVLDEVCIAIEQGLLNENDVIDAVKQAQSNLTLVLTGRHAPAALIEIADTVSDIKCIKHAYDEGINAQKGVEF